MSPRWDKRLRLPKSDGGATICEKHEFIEAHFRDPEMSWEVDQALTQAKDDGKRMEARIQELGEEANSLEEALQEMEADRDALRAELDRTNAELERARRSQLRRLDRLADQRCDELLDLDAQDTQGDGFYWRWFGRMVAFRDAIRAALERKADA